MASTADIEAQAARWLALREGDDWSSAEARALQAWLAQSFAHKSAYWRLQHGWGMMDRLKALALPEPEDIGRERRVRRWMPGAIAASLVAGAIGVAVVRYGGAGDGTPLRYATAVGERSSVPLRDGSKIDLDTHTGIRVAVTPRRREIWLDAGQAYFAVRHIDGTPFVVHAGPRTITVLGTKFTVRRDAGEVRVAVVEGRVRMSDARGDAAPSAILTAGAVALVHGRSTLVTYGSPADMKELGWRQGVLVFDRTTLRQAAAEFNRYNLTQLVIADDAAGETRIGGSFSTTGIDAFAQLLSEAYGFDVRRAPGKITIGQ